MAKSCPFREVINGYTPECNNDCSLYNSQRADCTLTTLTENVNALTQTIAEISIHLMNISETMALQRVERG